MKRCGFVCLCLMFLFSFVASAQYTTNPGVYGSPGGLSIKAITEGTEKISLYPGPYTFETTGTGDGAEFISSEVFTFTPSALTVFLAFEVVEFPGGTDEEVFLQMLEGATVLHQFSLYGSDSIIHQYASESQGDIDMQLMSSFSANTRYHVTIAHEISSTDWVAFVNGKMQSGGVQTMTSGFQMDNDVADVTIKITNNAKIRFSLIAFDTGFFYGPPAITWPTFFFPPGRDLWQYPSPLLLMSFERKGMFLDRTGKHTMTQSGGDWGTWSFEQ